MAAILAEDEDWALAEFERTRAHVEAVHRSKTTQMGRRVNGTPVTLSDVIREGKQSLALLESQWWTLSRLERESETW